MTALISIRRSMGGHENPVNQKDEWLTPPEIINALGGFDSFDLDPCAPIERPWPTAKHHYTVIDDGLKKPWRGRVWLNPPYGAPKIVGPWLRRMVEHNRGTMLIFARTETELFFETVWRRAASILFIRGRLSFYHVNGCRATANAGAPSCLVAYGKTDAEHLARCGIDGQLIELNP